MLLRHRLYGTGPGLGVGESASMHTLPRQVVVQGEEGPEDHTYRQKRTLCSFGEGDTESNLK